MKYVRQDVRESFRVAGHFKRNIEAFLHAEFFHGVSEFFGAHVDPLRVRAKMTTAAETIPAMATGDMAFANDEIAVRKSLHMIADKIDNPNKFMTDSHRHWNRFLRPRIPVVDVNIGAAD